MIWIHAGLNAILRLLATTPKIGVMQKPTNFTEYAAAWPSNIQTRLRDIHALIKATAPEAEESISYGMPAFKLNGPLVYFAAFKNHIGLYALPSGNAAFQRELQNYKTGKGSIQFPNDRPLPMELIENIVRFRMKENQAKQ